VACSEAERKAVPVSERKRKKKRESRQQARFRLTFHARELGGRKGKKKETDRYLPSEGEKKKGKRFSTRSERPPRQGKKKKRKKRKKKEVPHAPHYLCKKKREKEGKKGPTSFEERHIIGETRRGKKRTPHFQVTKEEKEVPGIASTKNKIVKKEKRRLISDMKEKKEELAARGKAGTKKNEGGGSNFPVERGKKKKKKKKDKHDLRSADWGGREGKKKTPGRRGGEEEPVAEPLVKGKK